MLRPPPTPTLFPYTTLFRSVTAEQLMADINHPASKSFYRTAGLGYSLFHADSDLRILTNTIERTARELNNLPPPFSPRSEEHTSELQSQFHLVCRLLLEKKK